MTAHRLNPANSLSYSPCRHALLMFFATWLRTQFHVALFPLGRSALLERVGVGWMGDLGRADTVSAPSFTIPLAARRRPDVGI